MDYSFKRDAIIIAAERGSENTDSGYEIASVMPLLAVGGTVFMDTIF